MEEERLPPAILRVEERSFLERGLYERWILRPKRSGGVSWFRSVGSGDTWRTDGVSGQEKSSSSEGNSWRSSRFDMIRTTLLDVDAETAETGER